MILENMELLRSWLTEQLSSIFDADPTALARYVLALIRKDKAADEELRQSLLGKLDVFLHQQTIPFVDRLLQCINSKEYLVFKDSSTDDVVQIENIPNPSVISVTSDGSRSSSEISNDLPNSTDVLRSKISDSEPQQCTEPLIISEVLSENTSPTLEKNAPRSSNVNSSSSRRDKPSLAERDRIPRRRSRSPRRNRSRDRIRRSWSPKDNQRGGRPRGIVRRSPIRRNDRDIYDRRRSPRNRSSSPFNRRRSPHRQPGRRAVYVPKRLRSPIKVDRSRSRSPIRGGNRVNGTSANMKCGGIDVATTPIDQSQPNHRNSIENLTTTNDENFTANTGNRCKDYDERGLCMRGELCPFDHGQNPVVLQDVAATAAIGLKRNIQLSAESNLAVLPYGGVERDEFHLVQPSRGILGGMDSDIHGVPPPWVTVPVSIPPFPGSRMRPPLMMRPPLFPMPPRELINVPVLAPPGTQMVEEEINFPTMHSHSGMRYAPQRNVISTGRGGWPRGRGGFDQSRLGSKTKVYTNCSLEVKKIPSSQNTIAELNTHFNQFGKIINIQINFENDPEAALITFSSPNEAYVAYKSTEAVLNNRFIRVFWHNKEKENENLHHEDVLGVPGKDRLGFAEQMDEQPLPPGESTSECDRILTSAVNMSKPMSNKGAHKREISQEKVQAVEAIKMSQEKLAAEEKQKKLQREALKVMQDLQKKNQIIMMGQIEQQKKLINILETNKSMKPEDREELMNLLKTLQGSIEALKKDIDFASSNQNKFTHQATPYGADESEGEMYLSDYEGSGKVAVAENIAGTFRGRGGFRGNTRGNYKSGRGGGTISRTVDRRTTSIFITGFTAAILPELMAHFAQYGAVIYHKPDYVESSLTITYENRKCAETAFAKGRMYKDYRLDIKWMEHAPEKHDQFKCDSPSPPPTGLEDLDYEEDNLEL